MTTSMRRSTSLTLDRTLLDEAKRRGVNISRAAERGISDAVKEARTRQWREENAEAIADYNRFIDENGIPLSEYRKF